MQPHSNMPTNNNSFYDPSISCEEQYLAIRLIQGVFGCLIIFGIPANLVTLTGAFLTSKTSRKHKLKRTIWFSNLLALAGFLPLKITPESWINGSNFCVTSVALKSLWISQIMPTLLLLSFNQYLELYKAVRRKTMLRFKIDGKVSIISVWCGSLAISAYVFFSSSRKICASHLCSLHRTVERYFGHCFVFLIVIIPFIGMAFLNFGFHKLSLNHIHSVGVVVPVRFPNRTNLVDNVRESRIIFRLYYCVLSLYLPDITFELLGFAKLDKSSSVWPTSTRAQIVFDFIFCSAVVFLPVIGYFADTKLQSEVKKTIRSLTQSKRSGYVLNYPRHKDSQSARSSEGETRDKVIPMTTFSNISPNGPLATLGESMCVDENALAPGVTCYNPSCVDTNRSMTGESRDSAPKVADNLENRSIQSTSFTDGILLETTP